MKSARTAWSHRFSAGSRVRAAVAALAGLSFPLAGCGSRTGLELDELGAPPSAVPDAAPPPDAGHDAASPPDAAIPISPPNTPAACVQLPEPSIYMVSISADLWQFKPGTDSSPSIALDVGHLDCPVSPTSNCNGGEPTPFSMAVDLMGTAYVVFCDGEVFQVNTQELTCKAVGVVPEAGFGMAFSQDTTDADETLFVAEGQMQSMLASIDTTTLAAKVIGNFSPTATNAELTGTGAGDLFLFYVNNDTEMSIAKVDKTNAVLTNILPLPNLQRGNGWAFVFWGGNFYTFTGSTSAGSVITRISPVDGSQTPVDTVNDLIVGAGVSTCAPQQ